MTGQESDQMPPEHSYLTPLKIKRCRFNVQGSRFIATIAPAVTEVSARETLATVRAEFSDATHHTYAYRIGSDSTIIERSSDDREPAGTAGMPMLQVLQGNNVSDAIIIGTRYFGGTKLGIGGLVRAYRDCARLSLEVAILIQKEPLIKYQLRFAYEDLGPVNRIIETYEANLISIIYGEGIKATVSIPARLNEFFYTSFESACRGRGTCRKLPFK